MFSFTLIGWVATLPVKDETWRNTLPLILSVFLLPPLSELGLLTRPADKDGSDDGPLLYLIYGAVPLITRSVPWYLCATVTKVALDYREHEIEWSLHKIWKYILFLLPVFFVASGGLVGGRFEEGHYKEYSERWTAFVAVFQCNVLQVGLLGSEVWEATGYESVPANFRDFGMFEWVAVVNMFLLTFVALCFGTILSLLQKIWYPLEYMLGCYWFLGPMIQLLAMWRVTKDMVVLRSHEDEEISDDRGLELEVVNLA